MTQDEIIRMAREAGFQPSDSDTMFWQVTERFAALVAAHEREACAKVCEGYTGSAQTCAAAIRARSEK